MNGREVIREVHMLSKLGCLQLISGVIEDYIGIRKRQIRTRFDFGYTGKHFKNGIFLE